MQPTISGETNPPVIIPGVVDTTTIKVKEMIVETIPITEIVSTISVSEVSSPQIEGNLIAGAPVLPPPDNSALPSPASENGVALWLDVGPMVTVVFSFVEAARERTQQSQELANRMNQQTENMRDALQESIQATSMKAGIQADALKTKAWGDIAMATTSLLCAGYSAAKSGYKEEMEDDGTGTGNKKVKVDGNGNAIYERDANGKMIPKNEAFTQISQMINPALQSLNSAFGSYVDAGATINVAQQDVSNEIARHVMDAAQKALETIRSSRQQLHADASELYSAGEQYLNKLFQIQFTRS